MISLICPSFGRISYLEESIESFLKQNRKDIELIIVNDNKSFNFHYKHSNIKIFNLRERFKTLGEKRNYCVEQCSGDIIVPLDDDDIILPDYVDICERDIKNVDWFFPSRSLIFNRDENIIKISRMMLPNLVIFRKSLWNRVKFPNVSFDENRLFLKNFSQTPCFGKLTHPPLKEMSYLIGWQQSMNRTYHTQEMYRYDNKDFYNQIQEYVDNKIKNKELVAGDIELRPHWKYDYIKLKEEFIDKYSYHFDKI